MKMLSNLTCVGLILISTAVASAQTGGFSEINFERVADGLSRPIFATSAPGDPDRLFVVEQHSADIKILDLATNTVTGTFLDLPNGVTTGNEQGLLGLAFHPDYASNGLFYVNYTNSNGDTQVQEYSRLNANQADTSSARNILSIDQPFSNHNGGWMGFGQDNLLYVGTGDGGSANDPLGNSQDITNNLLGKMLRIDVNGDDFAADANRNYAIPNSNPFVGQTGDDEIFAYGLRNPWRSSFDRQTGDLWIGDVGQNAREEINVLLNGTSGQNYGWRDREGTVGSALAGAIDPIYDYSHGSGDLQGFSVTGGYVYRGPIEALDGHYFFADFVTDNLWSMKLDGTDETLFDGTNFSDFVNWTDLISTDFGTVNNISSFAEDGNGNLYIVGLDGEIFRLVSVPEPASGLILLGLGGLMAMRRRR
ncbi:PQQ-dependent sugar dehydrogenase [Mariniblastus fucicola]|uniref:Soluble aldose sugar dehydrogenase YliI n=1 Tax=Mariniblastus fucicola TaxID=980251 RepID=A0A5B9P434_9BACT|nr:PQQ-dependent sugar dehydrogenase [Mariniblastus fucicola]QEG20984.1 Soluble aldose sugar dehydrogenase YliI precursor [Mariniblastus fucicola]